MKTIFTKLLQESKIAGKVRNSSFVARRNGYVLSGCVKDDKYSMTIKDSKGNILDESKSTVGDVAATTAKVKESLDIFTMLSDVNGKSLQEADDVEEIETFEDDEIETGEVDLVTGLDTLYGKIIDVAEYVQVLKDSTASDDAETLSTLISFESTLYDCAIDVDDFLSDLAPDEEIEDEVTESVTVPKTIRQQVLNNLIVSEGLLRDSKDLADIRRAIKDIRAELTVRGE